MASETQTVEQNKIVEDINEFFEIYELGELDTVEDLEEGIRFVAIHSKAYRGIHAELKSSMSAEEYSNTFVKLEKTLDSLRSYTKNAKKKLKDAKKEEKESLVKDKNEETRTGLRAEEEVFRIRLKEELCIVELSAIREVSEISEYISKLQMFVDNLYALSSKLRAAFGGDYNTEFGENFKSELQRLNYEISDSKRRIKEILQQQENSCNNGEKERSQAKRDKEVALEMIRAENLYREIELRCDNLRSKCEANINSLDDYQILELSKSNNIFDTEMREILDKTTSFAQFVTVSDDTAINMLNKLSAMRDETVRIKIDFFTNLSKNIIQRDISEEKLKRAANIKIELEKFKGYESKMNIYTFHNEFQKLVEPALQKKYWPDYLKKNY